MKKVILALIVISIVAFSCTKTEEYSFTPPIEKINLNDSIRIRSISFFNNENGLLCGGLKNQTGSIYYTEDGGENWTKSFYSDSLSVNNLFYLNQNIVFACGDSLLLLKSIDGGKNWEQLIQSNLPYDSYSVPYHNIYANSETNIFVIGGEHFNKGIISKTETGNYPWIHDTYDNQFNAMCFVSEYVGFFAGYGILIVTEDGGNTFDYIDLESENFVDLKTDKHNTVYALSDNGILYSTTDLGYNWDVSLKNIKYEFTNVFFGDELSVVAGKKGVIYIKYDNQNSWSKLKSVPAVDFHCSFVKDNNEIFLGSDKSEIYILNKRRNP